MEKKTPKTKAVSKPKVTGKTVKTAARKKATAPAVALLSLNKLAVPTGAHKRKKLLGRGPSSGHGKTSTRGSKGQTSRAGRDMYAGFEGGQTPMIRRMPKRGFTSRNFKNAFQVVNLGQIGKLKETAITPEVMKAKGLINDAQRPVKVLGDGEISRAVTVNAHAFSKSAEEKLTKSGSKFEVINA